ncbi:MAG TPA: hypothetical protein VLE53_02830 [Gemmatimonadaceae bacterium]|nr:hypothetical protein [Gemmatimonadaceae bacterium]
MTSTFRRSIESVVLFGHGMLNTLISRALRRGGWTASGSPRTHWGSVSLRRELTGESLVEVPS